MISINKFTRSRNVCFAESMVLVAAIALLILTPDAASAKEFKIGGVKQQFHFGGICRHLLPKTQKDMLIIPFPSHRSEPVIAWINIDGKDFSINQISIEVTKYDTRSITKYQSKGVSMTVDSQNTKKDNSGMYTEASENRITIDYRGQIKIINTTGSCSV